MSDPITLPPIVVSKPTLSTYPKPNEAEETNQTEN